MTRQVALLGAPSSLGMRPYEDGEARHLDWAPRILRERKLAERISAMDLGDVVPLPYRDYVRPPNRPRNEKEVLVYSREIGEQVARAASQRRFTVVLGGDCSIVLGCALGARQAAGAEIGLVFLDAHADFATPEESRTGSVAGMCLGLATGRGSSPLARLTGRRPLIDASHAVLLGRRASAAAWLGHTALASSGVLDVPAPELTMRAPDDLAHAVLARVAAPDLAGFWIHFDVDVLNPAVMPAVDSPEPGGPLTEELVALLTPVVRHPRALGLSVAVYDPALDADRSCARQLVKLLETLLGPAPADSPR